MSTTKRAQYTADRVMKREHKEIIDKTPEFPAPFIVVVQRLAVAAVARPPAADERFLARLLASSGEKAILKR